ncbi:TonB-dependent receptor [Thalassotalea sp. PLHSN55]|uniref:TonB-dependent receptor n=1 Tax=Thalassotalea sp. PLHSN55 TaxID=3435888 RepID=UPI003F847D05
MQKKFALSRISQACLIAASVSTLPALAQDKVDVPKITAEEVEVITVTGVRGSLKESMNDKRFSTEIKDTISAEDIGQLPDENIAEALQRVTGIQMGRSADGEGSSVQIRGISDNNVEINGQVGSGSGAGRSINFQDLPSELFSGIEVLKAPTSDRIEGSLGGTVNLKTRRPLDMKKNQVATVSAKTKYNEQSGEFDPDFNAFLAKSFRDTAIGDFGVIVNAGRKNVTSKTDVYGAGDFESADGAWLKREGGIDVNGDGEINNSDVYYIPNGLKSSTSYKESQRDSFNTTLQWQPNDITNFFFDYTFTQNDEFVTGSSASMASSAAHSEIKEGSDWSGANLGDGSYIINEGTISGASVRMGGAPSIREKNARSHKFTLGGDVQVNDSLNIAMQYNVTYGRTQTEQAGLTMGYDWNGDNRIDGKDWGGDLNFDFSGGGIPNGGLYDPETGEKIDITNPLDDRLHYYQMQRIAHDARNRDDALTLDFTLDLDNDFFTQFKSGIRVAGRSFEKVSYENMNQNKQTMVDGKYLNVNMQKVAVNPDSNEWANNQQISSDLAHCLVESDGVDLEGSDLPENWIGTDCDIDFFTDYFNMHDIRAINEETGYGYYEDLSTRYDIGEDTLALYMRADFSSEIGDLPFYGNFGARYIETKTTSAGYEKIAGGSFDWNTYDNSYHDFLPSMNLNLGLNDEMIMRFAAYKAVQRPGLGQISPSTQYFYGSDIDDYNGTAILGNPDLDPVRAVNLDLSYEWYYSAESMFSAALFYKDLDSIIALPAETFDLVIGDETFQARQYQNLPGTTIYGAEFALQHSLADLGSLFEHTGLGLNYTFSDEDSDLTDTEGNEIGRRGLSKHSYNVSAFYDDGDLSVRLAYNWRSEFTRRENVRLGWGTDDFLPELEDARGQLDLSVNYKIGKHLKVNFSAINLNDSKTIRYLHHEELINYIAAPGRRFNLGMVYRF